MAEKSRKEENEAGVMEESVKRILKQRAKDFTALELADGLLEQNENMSIADAVVYGLAIRAAGGDTGAAAFLRDTAGEKPKDRSEVENKLEVAFSMELVGASENQELSEKNNVEILPDDIEVKSDE